MSENLRRYTKALYAVDGVVRRLKSSDWAKQSPNEEWSARETLGHTPFGEMTVDEAIGVSETASATDKLIAFTGRKP